MEPTTAYYILLWFAIFLSIVFVALIYFTGKGDAMSGSGSIRTTFKGKASIEDKIARLTYILAAVFMALMLGLDLLSARAFQ